MAERRRRVKTGEAENSGPPSELVDRLEWCRGRLAIDKDDLDTALTEQAVLYDMVTQTHAAAVAARDAAEFTLSLTKARLCQGMRIEAAEAGEKMTEGRLDEMMKLTPEYQDARSEYNVSGGFVERTQAAKESFQQRSFMLRELVAVTLAHMSQIGLSGGTAEARNQLSEGRREQAATLRRQKRGES